MKILWLSESYCCSVWGLYIQISFVFVSFFLFCTAYSIVTDSFAKFYRYSKIIKNFSSFFLKIQWPCIVTDSLWIRPTDALNSNFIGITTTCFGQPFCPSLGVLSRTSALVHFMQLRWPFATRGRMELQFHLAPGSKRSSQLHKMYPSRCTAKNSWWWAERLAETCSRNTDKILIQCICWSYSQGILFVSPQIFKNSPKLTVVWPCHILQGHLTFFFLSIAVSSGPTQQ